MPCKQRSTQHYYYVGASHLFGVAAIALIRSGDPKTGAKLVGLMIANGHRPRSNASHALTAALGDAVDGYEAAGDVADRVAGRAHCRHGVGRCDRTNRDIAMMSNGTGALGFFLSLSPV